MQTSHSHPFHLPLVSVFAVKCSCTTECRCLSSSLAVTVSVWATDRSLVARIPAAVLHYSVIA